MRVIVVIISFFVALLDAGGVCAQPTYIEFQRRSNDVQSNGRLKDKPWIILPPYGENQSVSGGSVGATFAIEAWRLRRQNRRVEDSNFEEFEKYRRLFMHGDRRYQFIVEELKSGELNSDERLCLNRILCSVLPESLLYSQIFVVYPNRRVNSRVFLLLEGFGSATSTYHNEKLIRLCRRREAMPDSIAYFLPAYCQFGLRNFETYLWQVRKFYPEKKAAELASNEEFRELYTKTFRIGLTLSMLDGELQDCSEEEKSAIQERMAKLVPDYESLLDRLCFSMDSLFGKTELKSDFDWKDTLR